MDQQQKEQVIAAFKKCPVAENIEALLRIFKSKKGVLDFCLGPVSDDTNMCEVEKAELKEVVTEAINDIFEKLDHRLVGAEILKQID